jgi:short-subunit dehydrogenase
MSKHAKPTKPRDGVCWITGASSGIGEALARHMIKKGWRVVVSARSASKLEELVATAPDKIFAAPLDIADYDRVPEVVAEIEAKHGPIARAVLNAGIYLSVNAEAPNFEDYKRSIDVNLTGTAACVSALTPRFAERRLGQLAIVSSVTGYGGLPTSSAYGATKAGLINMAECLRIELDRYGVLVQCVTPGFVETPAQDDNAFPKPFMVSSQTAARRMFNGMKTRSSEITFPKRFTWLLKLIYVLPRKWHINLIRRQTGWDKPLDS